jgi:Putative beta-barrel porin 2
MSAAWLLAVALLQAPEEPGAVLRFERVGEQTLVHVQGVAPATTDVRREGSEIVVSLAGAAEGIAVPPALSPVEDLQLQMAAGRLELRLRCDPSTTLEVRRSEGELVLVLGARPASTATRSNFPELYRSLFPAGVLSDPIPSADETRTAEEVEKAHAGEGGLNFGPVTLRPAVLASYVNGENALEDSQPVHDSYIQIEPRLGLNATVQLLGGRLRVGYQPVFRRNSSFDVTRGPAHQFDANLDQPVGSAVTLRASAHHARGALETNEVDPGREYFFGLGGFRRWRYGAGLRLESGGRFDLDLSGALNRVRFSEATAFFPYDERSAMAELGYDLAPTVRAGFGYVWSEVPSDTVVGRPEAASRTRGLRLALTGEMATFAGELSVAYMTREHPQAAAGGERFAGLVTNARLSRELRPATTLALNLNRFATLSAFERNGYYLANVAEVVLTAPVPLGITLRGGVGMQRNDYATDASALGRPRRDTLRGWTIGLGRGLTRWAFARADYRADRRDSNLDAFDNRTHTLIVQLGVGWLGAGSTESSK